MRPGSQKNTALTGSPHAAHTERAEQAGNLPAPQCCPPTLVCLPVQFSLLSTLSITHSPFSQTSPFISPLIFSKWLSHSTEKRDTIKQELLQIPPSTSPFLDLHQALLHFRTEEEALSQSAAGPFQLYSREQFLLPFSGTANLINCLFFSSASSPFPSLLAWDHHHLNMLKTSRL